MEISIQKISKKLKIDIPDLITRPVGKRIYKQVAKSLEHINLDEVVVIDFESILVMDPSCSDEIIVNLIVESKNEDKPYFVKLKNISEAIEMNLSAVFDSYNEYNDERLVVITEDLTSKNHYYIGEVSSEEHEIIDYLKINKESTLNNIADYLNKTTAEIEKILENMNQMRIVRLAASSSQKVYQTV